MDSKNVTPGAPGDKQKTQAGPDMVAAMVAHNSASFAETLVKAFHNAVVAYHEVADDPEQEIEADKMVLATRSDLIQALTIPAPEADDYPTVRDQFAMAALQGLLAAPNEAFASLGIFVTSAYKYADAMIAARKGA